MSGPLGSASSPVLALSHVLWLPWVLVTNLSFQALHYWATFQQCPESKELVRGQWQEPCCSLASYIVCQAHEHPQPHPTACRLGLFSCSSWGPVPSFLHTKLPHPVSAILWAPSSWLMWHFGHLLMSSCPCILVRSFYDICLMESRWFREVGVLKSTVGGKGPCPTCSGGGAQGMSSCSGWPSLTRGSHGQGRRVQWELSRA